MWLRFACRSSIHFFKQQQQNANSTPKIKKGLRGPIWRRLLPSHPGLAQAFGDWLRAGAGSGEGQEPLETVHRRHGVPNQVRLVWSVQCYLHLLPIYLSTPVSPPPTATARA